MSIIKPPYLNRGWLFIASSGKNRDREEEFSVISGL